MEFLQTAPDASSDQQPFMHLANQN